MPKLLEAGVLLLLCLATPLASADTDALQRLDLPGHGALLLTVPAAWTAEVQVPPGQLPPTIVFGPRRGAPFEVLVSVFPGAPPAAPVPDLPVIHEQVVAAAKDAESQSVERPLVVRPLGGPSAQGFYFAATDRAPAASEYRYLTQGILRTATAALAFTVLTNDGGEGVVARALEMLGAARHEPAGG